MLEMSSQKQTSFGRREILASQPGIVPRVMTAIAVCTAAFSATPAASDVIYDPGGRPPYDTSIILEREDLLTPDAPLDSGVGDDLSDVLDQPAEASGLPGWNFGLAYTSVFQSANRSLGRRNVQRRSRHFRQLHLRGCGVGKVIRLSAGGAPPHRRHSAIGSG